MSETFTNNIKKKLEELNISQAQCARSLDVSKDYLNRILHGRDPMTLRMQNKLDYYIKLKTQEDAQR